MGGNFNGSLGFGSATGEAVLDGFAALGWLAVGFGAVNDGIGGAAFGDDDVPIFIKNVIQSTIRSTDEICHTFAWSGSCWRCFLSRFWWFIVSKIANDGVLDTDHLVCSIWYRFWCLTNHISLLLKEYFQKWLWTGNSVDQRFAKLWIRSENSLQERNEMVWFKYCSLVEGVWYWTYFAYATTPAPAANGARITKYFPIPASWISWLFMWMRLVWP